MILVFSTRLTTTSSTLIESDLFLLESFLTVLTLLAFRRASSQAFSLITKGNSHPRASEMYQQHIVVSVSVFVKRIVM